MIRINNTVTILHDYKHFIREYSVFIGSMPASHIVVLDIAYALTHYTIMLKHIAIGFSVNIIIQVFSFGG